MPDRALPDRQRPRRAELEAPYRRPLRHVAAVTWRGQPRLRGEVGVAVAVSATGVVGAVAASPLLWLLAAAGAMVGAYALSRWTLLVLSANVRLRRAWAQRSELRAVREARPHAASEDPEFAHDQFAVTAQDDGWLLTWRFRPLAIAEQPGDDEVEVPGRPRYAAKAISESRFDALDAARAAEQLVAAQDAAAAREAAAAARGGPADATDRAELAIEARTTAAALRRATGQDAGRRRDR